MNTFLIESKKLTDVKDCTSNASSFSFFFRQKALKALNERLQKLEQTSSWPSLDGPEGKDSPQSPGAVEEVPEIVVDQGTSKRTEGMPNSSSVPT